MSCVLGRMIVFHPQNGPITGGRTIVGIARSIDPMSLSGGVTKSVYTALQFSTISLCQSIRPFLHSSMYMYSDSIIYVDCIINDHLSLNSLPFCKGWQTLFSRHHPKRLTLRVAATFSATARELYWRVLHLTLQNIPLSLRELLHFLDFIFITFFIRVLIKEI